MREMRNQEEYSYQALPGSGNRQPGKKQNEERTDLPKLSLLLQTKASGYHRLTLKLDGTVQASGDNRYGQCNVQNGSQIVQDLTSHSSVGHKPDGTVLITGCTENGKCRVSDWNNIVQIAGGMTIL